MPRPGPSPSPRGLVAPGHFSTATHSGIYKVTSTQKPGLSIRQTLLAASPAARPRQLRLRSTVLLMLCMLVYMWFTATQKMLVQHTRTAQASATTRVRVHRALRGLEEAVPTETNMLEPRDYKRCRNPKVGVVVPHLLSVRQWHSSKPRQEQSVTLVTQLSVERLEMLANQCSVWPDPLAAVVYMPTVHGRIASAQDPTLNGSPIEEVVARLNSFHEHMQQQGACVLDLELATENFEDEAEAGLYPFNAARNRALMLAQTEALLLLDADFLPSPTIVAEYKTPEGYAELMDQLGSRQAIVLPAFETADNSTEGKQLAKLAVQRGKDFAVGEFRNGRLAGFQVRQYMQGHSPTNYDLWSVLDLPYVVDYKKGYEPYILVSRQFVPWYDERFRGYGRDKIQHLTHLAGLNMTFSVHPTGFVVHVPHKKAATFKVTKESGQWEKLYKLYVMVQKDVHANHFIPVVSFPTELCYQR